MGWRFRKSVKLAPGVKLNFGKKSVGVSVGGKYSGVSINSKTGVTTRTSIPGTGISYTQKVGGGRGGSGGAASRRTGRSASGATPPKKKPPVVLRPWYIILAALLIVGGLGNLPDLGPAILGVVSGGAMLLFTVKKRRGLSEAGEEDETQGAATPAVEPIVSAQRKGQNDVTIPARMGDCILTHSYPEVKIQPAEDAVEIAEEMQASGSWALDAVATVDGVELRYQGRKFADLLERCDMVRDWLERGDPMLIYLANIGASGDYVFLAFFRDEQKRLAHREQQVVRLTAYASEEHQDAIIAREAGDKLDLKGDDPDDGVEVCYGDVLGKLPKAAARRYLDEGCAGVFLDHVDYDDEKDKYIPYVKIYW